MFRAFSRPSSGAPITNLMQQFSILLSWRLFTAQHVSGVFPPIMRSSNHQPDATIFQFIILTFIYSSTCFGRFPAHHQELNDCSNSLWFYMNNMTKIQNFFFQVTILKKPLRLWRYLLPFFDVPVVSREEGSRYFHKRSVCFEYCVNGISAFECWWCYWKIVVELLILLLVWNG
jgi:hypothetical protein